MNYDKSKIRELTPEELAERQEIDQAIPKDSELW